MANDEARQNTEEAVKTSSQSSSGKALIFISHDTRDAEIAEAFSKLLSSVSAGVLKSFRSSDKKGNQGIEYGVDWYPEIMKKLDDASDVVCLLTPYSVNRPWILYEAGVAKGQLNTPVHGLALGISLSDASTGPFAQFQNSDDDTESITSMVMQLVSRIPNAEPDRDIVTRQVEAFQKQVGGLLEKQGHEKEKPKKIDNSSIAKLFEEIKVMYQDLPSRIEKRSESSKRGRRRKHRMHPMMLFDDMMMRDDGTNSPYLALMMWLGMYKEDFPWLYDLASQLYQAAENGEYKKLDRLSTNLINSAYTMRRNPIFEEYYESKEHYILIHELPMMLDKIFSRFKSRQRKKYKSQEDRAGHSEKSTESD